MDQTKPNIHEAEEANQIMSEKFKGYNVRTISAADSETESTNQIIQKSFMKMTKTITFFRFILIFQTLQLKSKSHYRKLDICLANSYILDNNLFLTKNKTAANAVLFVLFPRVWLKLHNLLKDSYVLYDPSVQY